jgi:hypothetical protein
LPVNIRRLDSLGVDDFGLYISSGMASLDKKSPGDFWPLARAARRQVLQALDPQVLRAKTAAMAGAVAGGPSPHLRMSRCGETSAMTQF